MFGDVRSEELVQVGKVLGEAQAFGEVGGEAASTCAPAGAFDQRLGQGDADFLIRRLSHVRSYYR